MIALEGQENTTFTYPHGTFEFNRMLFELCNVPATFQRCMISLFSDIVEEEIKVFMDELLVVRGPFNDCLAYLASALQRREKCNLVLNYENITLWRKKVWL